MGGPAFGDLELLRAFVNTTTAEHAIDDVGSPARMHEWLVTHSLLPQSAVIDEAAHCDGLEFREVIRALALANGADEPDPAAVIAFNRLAARLTLSVRLANDGSVALEPGGEGVDLALSRLSAIMFRSMVDGSFARLKACANDTCRWLFYDRSRNRSGKWCEMESCGNMINARAYRRRLHGDAAVTDGSA